MRDLRKGEQQPPSVCTHAKLYHTASIPNDSLALAPPPLFSPASPESRPLQAVAVEDVVWIRLFNILYRKHKSWMRQQGTPPTWDRDKVRIESNQMMMRRRKSCSSKIEKKRGAAAPLSLPRGNLRRGAFLQLGCEEPLCAIPFVSCTETAHETRDRCFGLRSSGCCIFRCSLISFFTHVASPHMQHSAYASVSGSKRMRDSAVFARTCFSFFCRNARAPRGSGL